MQKSLEAETNSSDYVREYELENDAGTLSLTQKEIGDVNCVVWDAALVLAKYLEKKSILDENFLKEKKVIELGAGLGCVGLVAAFYKAHVVLTDLPGMYLDQLEWNVKSNQPIIKNKGSAVAKSLDWNDENVTLGDCDILLAADCVYYKDSIPGLVNTILRLSSKKTDIYVSQENRSYSDIQKEIWENFTEEIAKYFKITVISLKDQHEQYQSADIFLFHLKKL